MKYGSLFTGAGGLDMAIEQLFDATPAWLCEFDKHASNLLEQLYPGVPNLGDITQVDWHAVEPIDILVGGSPCQDVSQAGKRSGIAPGTRSGLWYSMCDAIEVLQPKLVIWENVGGVLSAKANSDLGWTEGLLDSRADEQKPAKEKDHALRALGRVLGDLTEMGYDARWGTFRAGSKRSADLDHVGAPHQRARVFVVAYPSGERHGSSLHTGDLG